MSIEEAIQRTIDVFPFEGYITPERGAHSNIAKTVIKYLEPGSRILDFGSGPCDKTAILQYLGYNCSAFDDLQDDWHLLPGNQEKIISFAKVSGIDFRMASKDIKATFVKDSFDMVMLHDVLEHLHDSPRALLYELLELVKPNGLLFVTVPNAVNIRKRIDVLMGRTNLPRFDEYYWNPGSWRGHVREYVRNDLYLLSKYLDCEVLELSGCDHMLHKLPSNIIPVYLLISGVFQGWKDSWLLVARKNENWAPKKALDMKELFDILGKNTPYDYTRHQNQLIDK